MQRDDSAERVDRKKDPAARERDALRRSIDTAWSRLIHADTPNAGADTPATDAEPSQGEECVPPRPDSTASRSW